MLVRIGVDVGGTNTDAVVVRNNDVIGFAKRLTSENVTSGVIAAITASLEDAQKKNKDAELCVYQVNIGTTHFVNAVVQRRHLVPVAVMRLGGTATDAIPPFSGFPADLQQVIQGTVYLADGGYEVFGNVEITALDVDQLRQIIQQIQKSDIRNVVISGVFSPLNASQELQVGELFKNHFPECSFTLSHSVAGMGILERENAAILNETLKPLCTKTLQALRNALDELQLTCPFYLSRNDGTLINNHQAQELPVFTFASGPTNSMRGAAFLSGKQDAVVVDIGGTTTDVGLLVGGFPVEANTKVKVGGVRTNFRMPAVHSIGLGGGSVVRTLGRHGESTDVQVGPDSVGFRLLQEAMVFGGTEHLTATDIAVAAGLCDLGRPELVTSLPATTVESAMQKMHDMLERSIDEVKLSQDPVPVILVGGGSVLIEEKRQLEGASVIIKPPHFQVANAFGAALAQVAGTVDEVVFLGDGSREQMLDDVKKKATRAAIDAGADGNTVKIYECQDIPLSYVPGNVTRVKVRAVGDLDLSKQHTGVVWNPAATSSSTPAQECDPEVDAETGEWILSEWDVECMVIGAGILGCGGGGSPSLGRLRALQALRSGKRMRVITPSRHGRQMVAGQRVACVAFYGAPTSMVEKLHGGQGWQTALGALVDTKKDDGQYQTSDGVEYREAKSLCEQTTLRDSLESAGVVALTSAEIGGLNSIEPLVAGAHSDLPVVDCDFMGRAFPQLQMCTCWIYGLPLYPVCMADWRGDHVIIRNGETNIHVENFLRNWCTKKGLVTFICWAHLDRTTILERVVPHSLSRAYRLGRAVLRARRGKSSPVAAILDFEGGQHIASGKITDVKRTSEGGFAKGFLTVEGTGDHLATGYKLEFQNENLIIKRIDPDGKEKVIACVPDLITVVDADTGEPISTEELRYGQRVCLLLLAASPLLRTPEALRVVGPQAFGYAESDVTYQPFGEMVDHEPVPFL